MRSKLENFTMNIALIGGGRAAVTILQDLAFFGLKGHRIVGVADVRADAPGVRLAISKGISTFTDMLHLLRQPEVELVIELTGNETVLQQLEEHLQEHQQLIPASGARLLCDLIDAQSRHSADMVASVSARLGEVISRLTQIGATVDVSFRRIQTLLRESRMVSINASIEAARAGQAGEAFAAVVQRIHDLVESLQEGATDIGSASSETAAALQVFRQAKQQLEKAFGAGNGAATGSTPVPAAREKAMT